MKLINISLFSLAVLAAGATRTLAGACDGRGVADVLAQARAECCPARNRGAYVSCAAHVAKRAVKAGRLEASCKVAILKAGCGPTTTTLPPLTTTSTTLATTTTLASTTTSTSTTATPTTTTSTTAAPTTTTVASTTTSTSPRHTTTTASPTTSTSTTGPSPTSTTAPPATTTSTTLPATTTTSTTRFASTTTSLPPPLPVPQEICGNCIDDDGNGLTDFEDPACCPQLQSFTMIVTRGRIRPRGAVSRLRLKGVLAQAGLQSVNPLREDVFLQLRPAGGVDTFCAKLPAQKFMRMHGEFKFWDRKHQVASAKGIDDFAVQVRKDGSVRMRTLGKRARFEASPAGPLYVTVGVHDPNGDAGNSCSTVTQPFQSRHGQLIAP